jgi:hypothetical protein
MACAFAAVPALAQSPPLEFDTRPAIPTAGGDTGLWAVPTAEILPARAWTLSGHRVNADFDQGFTDISNWPVAFGAGVGGRAEVFAALTVVNRIDRDVRPLFPLRIPAGGVVNEYPFVTTGWSGSRLGDLRAGGKLRIASRSGRSPAAFAFRAALKIPTADTDTGAGTGKADLALDAIVSREINERIELSGFGGFIARGDPEGVDLLNGFRWGFGASLPTRRHLRLTAEVQGEAYSGNAIVVDRPIGTADGSVVPARSPQQNLLSAAIGLTWLGSHGLFAGGGVCWNLRMKARSELGPFEGRPGDAIGVQMRVGYRRR